MKKLSLDEIKKVEFEVLCEIDDICRNEKINYSLAYGTCLGAVRHHGFIPWDDDIDLQMPRDDYEKFLKYCQENDTPFYIISNRTDPNWPFLYTRVCDKNTSIPDDPLWKWRGEMGLFVDICAVDGLANTYNKSKYKLYKSLFRLSVANASNWKHFFTTRTHFNWYYDPIRFIFYIMGKFEKPQKLLEKVEKELMCTPIETVKYSAALGGAVAYLGREIIGSNLFMEYTELEFEGRKFFVWKEYDKYLTQIYGDYMTPPPKDQQLGHHYIEAWGD